MTFKDPDRSSASFVGFFVGFFLVETVGNESYAIGFVNL